MNSCPRLGVFSSLTSLLLIDRDLTLLRIKVLGVDVEVKSSSCSVDIVDDSWIYCYKCVETES